MSNPIWSQTEDYKIPEITTKRLEELSKRFRVCINHGSIEIEMPKEKVRESFIWAPKTIGAVKFQEIARVSTGFPCGYYGLFKPSIEEVLCQTPQEIIDNPEINAFFIDDEYIEIFKSGSMQRAPVVYGKIPVSQEA